MRIYLVGGAVRDILLGRPGKDKDYVVVGATPEDMLALGYTQVGADFPVFLHPDTGEEYALARTERKSRTGYQGFTVHASPEVTLEEDLARRDLTINAMAVGDDDHIIDIFKGMEDIQAKVLRHVGPAFSEDPVRILRVARFAARYPDFSVAPETMDLMRGMVAAGEVDSLVPERIWKELSRSLMEAKPSRMIQVLHDCGVLAKVLPEVEALFGVPQPVAHHPEGSVDIHLGMVLDWAAEQGMSLPVRFAALMHDVGKGVTDKAGWPSHHDHESMGVPIAESVCKRFKVPTACREIALHVVKSHTLIHRAFDLKVSRVVKLLRELDAFRRPERFMEILQACRADFYGRANHEGLPYLQPKYLLDCLAKANTVDVAAVVGGVGNKQFIAERIHAARVAAVKQLNNRT